MARRRSAKARDAFAALQKPTGRLCWLFWSPFDEKCHAKNLRPHVRAVAYDPSARHGAGCGVDAAAAPRSRTGAERHGKGGERFHSSRLRPLPAIGRESARQHEGFLRRPFKTADEAAKAAFADTVTSWSTIEIVRIGPVIEQNRFERVLYYPDKKGLGLKQVQRYLAEKDESVTSADGLKGKSVAAQGLGALEFVLYGTGADELLGKEGDFRCRFGAAIAGNIANVAAELSDGWNAPDGAQKNWTKPGPDNPVFRDEREALVALLGIRARLRGNPRPADRNLLQGAGQGQISPHRHLLALWPDLEKHLGQYQGRSNPAAHGRYGRTSCLPTNAPSSIPSTSSPNR